MWAWSIVHQVLNHVPKFSHFGWVTLHNVIDKDAHDLLRGLVNSFYKTLFHWSIGVAKALSYSHE